MSTDGDPIRLGEDGDHFWNGASAYRSRLIVVAQRLVEATSWKTIQGSVLNAQPGDWIVTDGNTEWTVAAEVFDSTYAQLDDGRYRKTSPVVARQVDCSTRVSTVEGPAQANKGDWLVRNPGGEVWPVSAWEFRRRYELLEL